MSSDCICNVASNVVACLYLVSGGLILIVKVGRIEREANCICSLTSNVTTVACTECQARQHSLSLAAIVKVRRNVLRSHLRRDLKFSCLLLVSGASTLPVGITGQFQICGRPRARGDRNCAPY